jgi:hypothetical protein
MKPCLVKKINPLDVGGYFLCGWMHFCAIIAVVMEAWIIPIIIMGVGAFFIACLAFFNWKIIHDVDKKELEERRKAQKAKEELEGNKEDEEEEP